MQLIIEDDSALKFYSPLFSKLFKNKNYNFFQKTAILSMLEMLRRPDRATPSSRIQFYIHSQDLNQYYDFRPKDLDLKNSLPLLKAIEYILSLSPQKQSVVSLAKNIDQLHIHSFPVSSDFEQFLINHKKEILKDSNLAIYYSKGDDLLTKHENFIIEM